ncbi:predicted protein [Naegleria gruberi]|uniref:Predicted protein n=1 Tax=Naegleria gruberi TaxID=5762 RepID=D2V0X1_NAEGR|nr:uncharacterized protein NAEGRDRAFT_29989 [Naegleria gruberi]EFC49802.1 predicted protein [Naegleria gruberi]|eukprot:XP_002682546.1 predicted protein [Naegleria gruberi strain NEG-M]
MYLNFLFQLIQLLLAALGPYSHASIFDDRLIFLSGQFGLDPAIGKLATSEEHGDVYAQTHQTLKNITNVLEDCGSSLSQVLKTTILLTSMDNFDAVNKIYVEYFTDNKPARGCFAVSQLPKNALIGMEVVAYKN